MACRAAWPADEETARHGFQFRRSGGSIRRTNSVNALPGSGEIDDCVIDAAEAHYAAFGQRSLFRLTGLDRSSDDALVRRGYLAEGGTSTLLARLNAGHAAMADSTLLDDDPGNGWLDARDRLAVSDSTIYRRMISLIRDEAVFSSSWVEGMPVSIAYGVIHDGILVIESVATAEAFRGRGLGKRTVAAILGWAREKGVGDAVLQVVSDNAPALALYRSVGFDQWLYDYRYLSRSAH